MSLSLEGAVAGLVSEAEHAIRNLNDKARPALAPLARLLLRTESIASSKVEGMQLGARELARAEARVESGQKASAMAIEILANIDAMVLAVDEASAPERFGVREIVAIHARLLARTENRGVAGKLRTRQNWVGGNDYNPCGADFVPPPPEHVSALLDDLCEGINDDRLPPIVQAALVHAQFETIHPFDDDNGRTGRALIHVVLRRRRVAPAYLPPVSVVLAAAKERYIEGLTAFRGDKVGAWVEHFAGAAARAAHLARASVEAVESLMEDWRQRLSASTGRAKAAVYQAIEQLQAAGVLVPLSESRRNQAWEAAGLLDLIATLEADRIAA